MNNLSLIKSFFYTAASFTPDALIRLYPSKIILPTYHLVSDTVPDHIKFLYKPKSRKEFIRDLDFLLKYYKAIDLHQLIKITQSKHLPGHNLFHLTFDDGLRECYDIIAPILQEKGVPATFLINPSFIDNKDLMYRYKASLLVNTIHAKKIHDKDLLNQILSIHYFNKHVLDEHANILNVNFRDYLNTKKPYMNEEEIRKLIDQGFTIGAHSLDHPQYSYLSLEEQLQQTQDSIIYLTKTFKLNYRVFAFPFTDDGVSKDFFDSVLNPTGSIADLTFGVAGIKRDYHPKNLQRVPMEAEFQGKNIIKGEYMYYSIKGIIGKNKIKRNDQEKD